ncbi:MAG TPA: YihY/virulence factor BrkB family protein, partial [Burkholderiales bacterium]|nr:YihY/virulence factor BrkB family protein [Burkholderiales bacterium]
MTFFRKIGGWLSQSVYVTLNLFFKKEIPNHASAVAHYFLLSAVPLAYLLNTIISGSPEPSEALYFLLNMLHLNFMDVDFTQRTDRFFGLFKVTSWVSILVLLWSSRGLMRSVQGAFAMIFAFSRKRRALAVNLISFLIIPFSFLILGLSMLGDYLTIHMNYSSISSPAFASLLKSLFILLNTLVPFLVTWAIAFLAYYFLPSSRPTFRLAMASSFLCALSIALFQFFTDTVFKVDQYIRIYGSLGAIIFAMIWAHVISFLFLLGAEFLYVTGKIDAISLEKIFLEGGERSKMAKRIEHFLFKRS